MKTQLAGIPVTDEQSKSLDNYLTANNILFGGWYTSGVGRQQLIGFVNDPYWGVSLKFSNGTKYRISLPFYWKEATALESVAEVKVEIATEKRIKDSAFYNAQKRHRVLCEKKLSLNAAGKNKNMSNAYINQELEMLRATLSQY